MPLSVAVDLMIRRRLLVAFDKPVNGEEEIVSFVSIHTLGSIAHSCCYYSDHSSTNTM